MNRGIPRIVIAAAQSGAGKTSLSMALVAALRRRGLKVQTFKVGPDFLDPSYLSLASGRPCYSLDGWMTGKEYVFELFHRTTRDADIAVIEGVMGLFDGADPVTAEGSTGEIARWLEAPVLLVVNVHGMARSLAALVKGFVEFEPGLTIAGIVANQSGSDHHKMWLSRSLKGASLPPLLGSVPRGAFPTLRSRHLGLVTADAQNLPRELLQQMADLFEKQVSLDTVLRMAQRAPRLPVPQVSSDRNPSPGRTAIGVASDKAFHFYYPDNLEALTKGGCDLIRFSPLEDRELPEGLNGLYFGGGYPEEHAEALSENKTMLAAIRQFAAKGFPIYAECGGLMYLTQGIETRDGREYPMAGLLPAPCRMLDRLRSLGYVEITLMTDSLWGSPGETLRGHEFHYSELASDPLQDGLWSPVYRVKRRSSEKTSVEGFQQGKILASYVHLHWASRPAAVESLIASFGGGS